MSIKKDELEFENELIDHLTKMGGTKQWQYEPEIKTNDDLWQNFKHILELHNQDRICNPLSDNEFNQVKNIITSLKTPYQAGQFLYGVNGISQVEVDLDNGQHQYLKVFDQDNIGAGDTVYQVVNQIERPAVIPNKKSRRFDTTLLINGLPIIQIEEKADGHLVDEALNQMHQYIEEQQYTGIFSTIQILVALTPHDGKYMANTTNFNKTFAFRWQRAKDNSQVMDGFEFVDSMLSIPMAHQMATNYIILDGTKKNQNIKVMRPYQVYATKRAIKKLRNHDFETDPKEVGYIWHATGSGKTISSFKAAWLASRLPNVDKVVFLVDRVALTDQTVSEYQAYDPENTDDSVGGVVTDTANRFVLAKKLKRKGNAIIVTSTQKMDALVRNEKFKNNKDHVVFIVDEAHRSTSGEMLERIKKGFPNSAWIGYTGTPIFDKEPTTETVFGKLIHAYTIKNAISDGNVLGFNVDFQTTIPEDVLKDQYLPEYFHERYPKKTSQEIKYRIDHMTPNDMDDTVEPSVFDNNVDHVKAVVDDIIKNWSKRSRNGEYNAILTTHVGGMHASTPMAMMYYREFKRRNKELEHPLKIGITFSQDTSNGDGMLEKNQALREAMDDYAKEFGTKFDDNQAKEYTAAVVSRLNRSIGDGNYFDIVIVVDQLLTGFDAPQLNTLYVDRTLHGASLIQAYSRTNRIFDMQTKPFGHVVNYRWPANSKKLMNEALAVYADPQSAYKQTDLSTQNNPDNPGDGVLVPNYHEAVKNLKKIVATIKKESDDFTSELNGETKDTVEKIYHDIRDYNEAMSAVKQYEEYDADHPEKLLEQVNLTDDDEERLTTIFVSEVKRKLADIRKVDISELNFDMRMEHVEEVIVNYSYLKQLIIKMINSYHNNDLETAQESAKQIKIAAAKLENTKEEERIVNFTNDVMAGDFAVQKYPVEENDVDDLLKEHARKSSRSEILDFKKKWGLVDIEDSQTVNKLVNRHVYEQDDLNSNGELDNLVMEASKVYKVDAESKKVRDLSKIKYHNQLKQQLTEFADKMKRKY